MSRSDTIAVTLAAFRLTGIHVTLVEELFESTLSTTALRPAGLRVGPPNSLEGFDMLGQLYDRALTGERCWLRHDDGRVHHLPVHSWLGGRGADQRFDTAVIELCAGPTIDLVCGPGRLVAHLVQRGIPALGVDQSETAVRMARRNGAPALLRDVFDPLPGTGRWHTVLLADGNIGLAGDPWRVLRRAAELLTSGGRCVAEFDTATAGVRTRWVRLESPRAIGPWFRWASVGIDCAAALAEEAGLAVVGIHPIGDRVVATLAVK